MDNPNVASGSIPAFLDSMPGYHLSNTEAVRGVSHTIGKQSVVAGQPSMAPRGSQPAFEKLEPKTISTNPGPMGTDYTP